MAFHNEDSLRQYLEGVRGGYGVYAAQLWESDVRSIDEIATASVQHLVVAGITSPVHADNIKAGSAHSRTLDARLEEVERKVDVLSSVSSVLDRLLQYDGDASTRHSDRLFKTALINAYSQQRFSSAGTYIQCMLTGHFLPSVCVVASHVFKHKWGKLKAHEVFMGFEDIDSVGNGLLLFKPLQWAFDRSKLCFVYDSSSEDFTMRILDPAIRETPLLHVFSMLGDHPLAPLGESNELKAAVGEATFGDFEHSKLSFSGAQRPMKRVLCFHAHRARTFAQTEGWAGAEEFTFEDFWCEGDHTRKVLTWLEGTV